MLKKVIFVVMLFCVCVFIGCVGSGGTDPGEYVAVNMSLRVKSWCDIPRVCQLKIPKSCSRPSPHAFFACGLHNF